MVFTVNESKEMTPMQILQRSAKINTHISTCIPSDIDKTMISKTQFWVLFEIAVQYSFGVGSNDKLSF